MDLRLRFNEVIEFESDFGEEVYFLNYPKVNSHRYYKSSKKRFPLPHLVLATPCSKEEVLIKLLWSESIGVE